MKYLVNKNRRSIVAALSVFALLMLIMMITSYFLHIMWAENGYMCDGSDKFIHFHPIINEYGSFLNLNLGLEYNLYIFIFGCALGFAFLVCFFFFQLYLRQYYHFNFAVLIPTLLLAATCLGRLVERILWKYTLDFIAIDGFGIWDIGDVYLFVGCIGLIVYVCVQCWYESKETGNMSKSEKKQHLKKQYRGFLDLILRNDMR